MRLHTVRALVSVDAVEALAAAVADPSREVRVAVAKGLAATHSPAPEPLAPLLADGDALVRAAALAALAATGCPAPYAARATAAHHTAHDAARKALAGVLTDLDADVRAYAARGAVVNDA